jgi:hypothetical protein
MMLGRRGDREMTTSDVEIFRSANLFLELHGEEAVAKARDMIRTMRERGDNDGADTWLRIIVEMEAMRRNANGGVSQ